MVVPHAAVRAEIIACFFPASAAKIPTDKMICSLIVFRYFIPSQEWIEFIQGNDKRIPAQTTEIRRIFSEIIFADRAPLIADRN